MAAVCSTSPGASNQPCTDSHKFNKSLCYPEREGYWYTDGWVEVHLFLVKPLNLETQPDKRSKKGMAQNSL